MKVVLLAGGRGTRLAEETSIRPKPMVEVGGKPLLWHIMSIYASHGYKDFVVACGYKGELIKEYFRNAFLSSSDFAIDLTNGAVEVLNPSRLDWRVSLVDTGQDTMTGGRLRRLKPWLDGKAFMVTYGDGLGNVDVAALVDFHRKHGKLATVTAVRPPARFGDLVVEGDRVRAFAEKPQTGEGWINGGYFVFEPGILDYIAADDTSLEQGPLDRLADEGQLMAFRHPGFWQPMDTLREKELLESLWAGGAAPWEDLALKRRDHAARIALLVLSSLVALWIGDAALAMLTPRPADGHGDRRTMLEVVRELRRGGQDAWPTVYIGNHWQERALFRDTLYPLASISGVTSVMCRETSYVTYQSDERGFTNPPGQWRLAQAELALVGDSYVMGWCVPLPESFAARIRARHPATIVLGHGASGPLSQLGQMREFLPPLRPRHVLWFYYEENDLPDLEDEKGHPILRRYLEPGFTQRLAERQAEVDGRLRGLAMEMESVAVRRESAARAVPEPAHGLAYEARRVLTLAHLRRSIRAVRSQPPAPRQRPCCDVPMLGQVARAMQSTVVGWGGDLTMVVLPSEIWLAGRPTRAGIDSTDRAIAVVDSLGVPVLDLRAALGRFGSAEELYVYQDSHFSARGHQAVGELVLEYLARRDSMTSGMVR